MLTIAIALALSAAQAKTCETPAAEAKAKPWYISNAEITFHDRAFRKYGLPRVLFPGEVTAAGSYLGVPVFLPSDKSMGEDVVYVLTVSAGCEYQPYVVKT